MTIDQNTHLWDRVLRGHVAQFARAGARHWHWHTGRRLDDLFHAVAAVAHSPVFLEVGAFDGTTALRVAAERPGTIVRAFEANPVKYAEFKSVHNYAAQGVDYVHTAVGDRTGTLSFYIEDPDGDVWTAGSSSLLPRSGADDTWAPDTPALEVEVPAARLDDLVVDLSGRCTMWVDVEGAAGMVLDGAVETLARCDLLKIEVEDRFYWKDQERSLQILQRLLDAGMVPLTRDDEYDGQYNLIATTLDLAADPRTLSALDAYLTASLPNRPSFRRRALKRGKSLFWR